MKWVLAVAVIFLLVLGFGGGGFAGLLRNLEQTASSGALGLGGVTPARTPIPVRGATATPMPPTPIPPKCLSQQFSLPATFLNTGVEIRFFLRRGDAVWGNVSSIVPNADTLWLFYTDALGNALYGQQIRAGQEFRFVSELDGAQSVSFANQSSIGNQNANQVRVMVCVPPSSPAPYVARTW